MKLRYIVGEVLILGMTTVFVAIYVQFAPALFQTLPQGAPITARIGNSLAVYLPLALVLLLVYLVIAQVFMRDENHADYDPISVARDFSQRIIGQPHESAMAEVTSAMIEEALSVRNSGWLLLATQGGGLAVTPAAGPKRMDALPTVLGRNNLLIQTLSQKHRPVFHASLARDGDYAAMPAAEKAWLENLGMEVYVPVYDAGLLTAILAVGPKRRRARFIPADLELLMILASQAAAVLKTMRVIADLRTLNQSMATLNQSLQKTNDEMSTMSAAKNDFLAIVSHELRTPVTQMLGFADLLSSMAQDNTLDAPTITDVTNSIVKACVRLGEVTTQMLEMAQLDVDAVALTYRETTLQAILKQAIEPYVPAMRERRIRLAVHGLQQVPSLRADEERLAGAFNQLVSNAIKFTPDGGQVTITARLLPADDNAPARAEVVVADSGIGIDPQQHELIFEKFYRVGKVAQHSTSTTKFMGGGPGLGLPVARGIIVKHGGRLWVESPGHDPAKCPGSRFLVTLPLQPPAFSTQALADDPAGAPLEAKKPVTLGPSQNPFVNV
jgi:signal transduction histidine kinase